MSYINLSKSAFFHNLDFIVKKTKDINKVALVLKDNAYGHGLLEVASMAKEYGITKVVVRNEIEAKIVKDMFEYILILSPDFTDESKANYIYTINSLSAITQFKANTRVELKVDTGMHRNGISIDEIELAKQKIKDKNLKLEGVFTHFRSADAMSSELFWQKKKFENIKNMFSSSLRFHSCNSAALLRTSDFNEDMVRVGILAYGNLEMDSGFEKTDVKPVLSLYGEKISTRLVEKGERVGYSSTYEAKEDMQVTCFDVGYADGLKRSLSSSYKTPDGYALLGRISMDNSSYEVDADEILIFDNASKLAKEVGTISYEILTSLSPYIKRLIVE